jgi:hypothetical protein
MYSLWLHILKGIFTRTELLKLNMLKYSPYVQVLYLHLKGPGWLAKRAMLNSQTEERNRWWFIDFTVLPSIFNSNLSPPEQCRKKLIDRRISRDCMQICKRLAKEINGLIL